MNCGYYGILELTLFVGTVCTVEYILEKLIRGTHVVGQMSHMGIAQRALAVSRVGVES